MKSQAPQWIRTSTRKPDARQNILLYLDGKVFTGCRLVMGGVDRWIADTPGGEINEPSHWMPLPPPPPR